MKAIETSGTLKIGSLDERGKYPVQFRSLIINAGKRIHAHLLIKDHEPSRVGASLDVDVVALRVSR